MGVESLAAASITGVTSSQVEAMCRFAPVSKPAFVKEPFAFHAPQSRERAGPVLKVLNACDMPIQFASKARTQKPGSAKVRTVAGTRTKNIKASLFEDDAAFDDITESCSDSDERGCVASSTEAASGEEATWACNACTFLNAAVMPSCELCGAARGKAPAVVAALPQPPPKMDTKLWPSISPGSEDGSWAICDASSIASSWVDMAEDQSFAEDGWTFTEESVVDKTEVPAPTGNLSWAQRAASARSATAAPSQAPRPAIPGQPARVQPRRPERIAEDEVMSEGELSQLEQRRLCPQGLHPSSQRAARIKESKQMLSFKRKGRF